MDQEELKQGLIAIENEYDEKKRAIRVKFAYSNNTHKKGDIISNGHEKIKIDKIGYTRSFVTNIPICKYKGLRLKKDNTPFKFLETAVIYQDDIINE